MDQTKLLAKKFGQPIHIDGMCPVAVMNPSKADLLVSARDGRAEHVTGVERVDEIRGEAVDLPLDRRRRVIIPTRNNDLLQDGLNLQFP